MAEKEKQLFGVNSESQSLVEMSNVDQVSVLDADITDTMDTLNLGPGACLVGSLEAGKKKTRRSKRSRKKADAVDDSLFSLKSVSAIEQSFALQCVDPVTGEVTIPAHLAQTDSACSSNNDTCLDPGGNIPVIKKKKKTRKRASKVENRQSVVPLDLNTLDSVSELPKLLDGTFSSPTASKSNKQRGSTTEDVLTPRPANEAGSSNLNWITPKDSPRRHGRRSHGRNTSHSNTNEEPFSDYFPEVVVEAGIEGKRLIEGCIRINPKNFNEAYITAPDKGQDILIEGIKNRNRALEGDEVVIQINPIEQWRGLAKEIQKTATVVFIRNKNHPRVAVGFLKPMVDRNPDVVLFSPRDSRVPRIRIPISCCPANFIAEASKYEKQLFLASITDWTNTRYATGVILDSMGAVGEIQAENVSILLENDLKTEPYSQEMYSYFPQSPYTIPEEEIAKREDLRKECIFTIDPATARDLDDAMSCKELANGNLEIGVHISDVSFFLDEGTPFDAEVALRATSTYLTDTVYHMLPRELCMLCSLLPGDDKLAYSVFWEMDRDGNVLSHRFMRSVINSCVQLSYEHAQEMLDSVDKQWSSDELPPIHGGFSAADLSRTVNHLHRVALIMRGRRFEGGALRIDQPKVSVSLDRDTGLPVGYRSYENTESHRLIEEFMLLANMTVAKRIFEDHPRCAFLRSHLPPHPYLMDQLRTTMESYGVHLDVSSAGALHRSMKKYDGEDFPSQTRMMVLYSRCSKPMARAKYFCTSGVDTEDFFHYALNVPLYTHFTSPIRRYPDIMVHRLLSASLGYIDCPTWEPDHVQRIASNCNKMKFAAKRAGEQSTEIYLSQYIGQLGQILESAVVVDVKDHSFDVIVCGMGITQRIYANKLFAEVHHVSRDKVSKLDITWLPTEEVPHRTLQTIEMFVIVKVLLTKTPGLLKIESQLMRPAIPGNVFGQVKI